MKYLIDFKNKTTSTDIQTYLQNNNCTVVKDWDNFDKVFLVEATSLPPITNIIERISEENSVAISPLDVISLNPYYSTHNNPDLEYTVNVGDTKDWWKNYCFMSPEFNNPTLTINRLGQNVNVYIMDSGIESTHPEFVDANISNLYSVTGEFSDKNGHGTALASVIVGKTCGITDANLKVVKIFDPDHTTLEHELLDAIDAIMNDHIDGTASVLNCSWAIPKNEWVEYKLRILEDKGIFIIAAAGNNGTSIEDVTPASMLDVLTVGAYNQNLVPCDFSNYTGGSTISVTGAATNHGELDGWAPGEEIWCAGLNGSYGYVAGTSIATAIASACMASNQTWYLDSDGNRMKHIKFQVASTRMPNSGLKVFLKKDILDLSDPKYANSINAVATLYDKSKSGKAESQTDEISCSIRVGSKAGIAKLYPSLTTKSIEFIQPLPANFEVLPDALLYGAPTIEQGPAGNDMYVEYTSSFIRTYTDDTTETVTLKIYVYGENMEPESLPSDDPVRITLMATNCSAVNVCYFTYSFDTCIDNCPSGFLCCGGAKTILNCECDGGGGGGCCFVSNTLVTMADGTTKAIEDIIEGDKVLSFDINSQTSHENTVEKMITRKFRNMHLLTLSNGETIITSDDHPFYTITGFASLNPTLTKSGYKSLEEVRMLKKGDVLTTANNSVVTIVSISPAYNDEKVYTFNVTDKAYPNYFANGVLVY